MFNTKNFEIYEYDNNTLGVIVYNHRMANRLSAALKYYDCKIKAGEEPLFLISRDKITEIYEFMPKANQNSYMMEKLREMSVRSI